MHLLKTLAEGFEQLAFPTTCVGCGDVLPNREHLLCETCVDTRFDDPNPANDAACGNIILPDGVAFQDAMWLYDKDSVLQTLMRMLKYEGMADTGRFLGRLAAMRIQKRHLEHRIPDPAEAVLLPVPVHKKRKAKRGYNQARLIAEGINELLHIPIATPAAVVRKRHTVTQTKYNFERRMKNLHEAFYLGAAEELQGRFVILVDDVFTTGSTCFTITEVIKPAQPSGIAIFTIGMA